MIPVIRAIQRSTFKIRLYPYTATTMVSTITATNEKNRHQDEGLPETCARAGNRLLSKSAKVVEAMDSMVTFQPMLAT